MMPDLQKTNLNVYRDLCPCNSGKKIIDCCFAEINTTPPGERTGYSHPNCYARILRDCSRTISNEHYISKSVLDLFEPKIVEISGVTWLNEGKSQKLNKNVLTSKVLCQRHNEALSGLDSIAQKFFRLVLGKTIGQWAIIVHGYEIERWMLKAYCGLISSGIFLYKGRPLPKITPSPAFLDTLYYRKAIPSGCGLLVSIDKSSEPRSGMVAWRPLISEKIGIVGLVLHIEFFNLILSFGKVHDSDVETAVSKGFSYHPNCIMIDEPGKYREIHFGWPEGKNITIRLR